MIKNKLIKTSKAVLLNDVDNIVIAINNMEAYQHLDDFDITLDSFQYFQDKNC